jgi:hypothetical protein
MSRAQEQRANVRRKTFTGQDGQAPLRCWLIDATAERYVSLADLSLDGARVLTLAPPGVGEKVVLRLDNVPGEPLVVTARVVWRAEGFRGRGGVMGLAFDSVSESPVLKQVVDGTLRAT